MHGLNEGTRLNTGLIPLGAASCGTVLYLITDFESAASASSAIPAREGNYLRKSNLLVTSVSGFTHSKSLLLVLAWLLRSEHC